MIQLTPYLQEHLTFENQLLAQRNTLLASENQRLLCQLSLCQTEINRPEYLNRQRLEKELNQFWVKSKQQLPNLLSSLGYQFQREIGPYMQWLKGQFEHVDMGDLFHNLIGIVRKLVSGIEIERKERISRKLQQREERLAARKTAKNRTQNIIHIIKEPTETIIQCCSRSVAQQLATQRQFFEKLIRKIRKDSISNRQIESIYDKLDQINRIKASLRKQQSYLTLLERQFQLGSLEPQILTQTIQSLRTLNSQYVCAKKQIEQSLKQF